MKSEWAYYPMSLFVTAIRSTIGGLVTFMLSLAIASWVGIATLAGHWVTPCDGFEAALLLFLFAQTILLACLQVWGLFYVALLIYAIYKLIHEEVSRIRMAAFLQLPQYICTIITVGLREEIEGAVLLRVIVVTVLMALITAGPFLISRIIQRKSASI